MDLQQIEIVELVNKVSASFVLYVVGYGVA